MKATGNALGIGQAQNFASPIEALLDHVMNVATKGLGTMAFIGSQGAARGLFHTTRQDKVQRGNWALLE